MFDFEFSIQYQNNSLLFEAVLVDNKNKHTLIFG